MSDNLEKFAFKMVHMQGFFNFKALCISQFRQWKFELGICRIIYSNAAKNAIAEADNFLLISVSQSII